MKGILTEAEKQYVKKKAQALKEYVRKEGQTYEEYFMEKLQISDDMRRYFDSKIKRKTTQALEDLTLIFQSYDPLDFLGYDIGNILRSAVKRMFWDLQREAYWERRQQGRKREVDKRKIKKAVRKELDRILEETLESL